VEAGETDVQPMFAALADRTIAHDDELPATGVSLEWERRLSAPFIVSADYGTRSSTMIVIDSAASARFIERSFDADGKPKGEVDYRFKVN
ncbi:MAG TPA: NRDE family protein, partial [Casimicrobiaceae bacterium]|nr:NRDE family protein [Casimicrobiaceae bacterium]